AGTGDVRDMNLIALCSGLRASEVLSLDRDSLDLKRGVIKLATTKNHDRRVVPLPAPALAMLRARPVALREVFPGWTLRRLEAEFKKRALACGWDDVTFHTLRHTFASHAAMSGVDLVTLARLLGHRNLNMVKRYAHLAPDHLHAAVDRTATSLFAGEVPHPLPHDTIAVA